MLVLLLTTSAQADVEINETNFPDDAFRSQIANMPEGKDGVLTDEEIAGIEELVALWNLPDEVSSLKGIEFFTSLKIFAVAYCRIKELDLSANKNLITIHIDLMPLENLNVTGLTSLRFIYCQRTPLKNLDLSTCTALEFFHCNDCCLTSLDLSNNTRLKEVECRDNQLLFAMTTI